MIFSGITLLSLLTGALASAVPQGANTWKTLQSIPIAPRQEHGVVALSEKTIAIIGGIVPNPDADGFNTTNIVQFYNTRSNSWRRHVTEAPTEVNHPNVAVVNGKIYLLGGLSGIRDGAWRAFSDSWVYNPDLDEWTELDSVPQGEERGSAGMGVYGHIIYLAGGMRTLEPVGPGGGQDTVDFVSAFDTKTSKWIDLPEAAKKIPEGRDHASASVVGNKFYVLGGRLRGQRNVKDTVFILDLENLEAGWTTSEAKMPTPRGGTVSGTIGTKVYVLGGEGNPADSESMFDQIEVFDTKTEKWEELGTMKLPRHGGAAVAINGGIYLPGGGIKEGGSPVDTLDVYWP
ncbi:Kelch domain-containing protein 8A [Fusarium austroafricanum]|uniref:Kelch domain-containing protein 8A n=1 Tax=Fusarium austroafricanum TaxID=2364996 RepID=A0A8H4JSV1_9HYPO|nr:Kelch domain-containing protein 8A [Fusarium austroafricanum]